MKKYFFSWLFLVITIFVFLMSISILRMSVHAVDILFQMIWDTAWKSFAYIGFIWFGFLFVRIVFSEIRLKKLYMSRDEEICKIRKEPVAMNVINGRTRRVELEFQEEISPLERQRRYDLEKMPFLRK